MPGSRTIPCGMAIARRSLALSPTQASAISAPLPLSTNETVARMDLFVRSALLVPIRTLFGSSLVVVVGFLGTTDTTWTFPLSLLNTMLTLISRRLTVPAKLVNLLVDTQIEHTLRHCITLPTDGPVKIYLGSLLIQHLPTSLSVLLIGLVHVDVVETPKNRNRVTKIEKHPPTGTSTCFFTIKPHPLHWTRGRLPVAKTVSLKEKVKLTYHRIPN